MGRFMKFVVMLGAWISAMAALISFASGSASAADLNVVKQEIAAGKAVLIDVREADEWKDGHLRDARSLPLSRIQAGIAPQTLAELAPAGTAIYLHCAAGARCKTAAGLLRPTGRDLRPLPQGYDDLLDAGFQKAAP